MLEPPGVISQTCNLEAAGQPGLGSSKPLWVGKPGCPKFVYVFRTVDLPRVRKRTTNFGHERLARSKDNHT